MKLRRPSREAGIIGISTLLLLAASALPCAAFGQPRAAELGENVGELLRELKINAARMPAPAMKRAANDDPYVRRCLENPGVPEGRELDVALNRRNVCRKRVGLRFGSMEGGRRVSRYRLTKSAGRLRVAINLYFRYRGAPQNKAASVARLQATKGCLVDFFAKHEMTLVPEFHVNAGLSDWLRHDLAVNLWDERKNADQINWAVLRVNDEDLTEAQVCVVVAHELGHALGLPDTYADPECPDRSPIGPPDDIMNAGMLNITQSRLYPWAIKDILKPLCGE